MNKKPKPALPRVLLIGHAPLETLGAGGTERYISAEIAALSDKFDFFYYYPILREGAYLSRNELRDSENRRVRSFYFSVREVDALIEDAQRDRQFAIILRELAIDVVHVHHMLGHAPSIISVAHKLTIPVMYSVHDFYTTCLRFHLQGLEGAYCGVLENGFGNCDRCLLQTELIEAGSFQRRLRDFGRMLSSVQTVHTPIEFLSDWMKSLFHKELRNTHVVTMPLPISPSFERRESSRNGPLTIIVPGNFVDIKGRQAILQCIELLKNDNVKFVIVGGISNVDRVRLGVYDNVILSKCDNRRQLMKAYSGADLSLHMSVVPETFSFTLSEAWMSGVVPIASDLGAFRYRITSGVNGVLVPPGDEADLARAIRKFMTDDGLLEGIKRKLPSPTDPDLHWKWVGETLTNLIRSRNEMRTIPTRSAISKRTTRWFPEEKSNSSRFIKSKIRAFVADALNNMSHLAYKLNQMLYAKRLND